jgi:hypothetical protein
MSQPSSGDIPDGYRYQPDTDHTVAG